MKQTTVASVAYDRKKKVTRRERFLTEMGQVILWGSILGLIELMDDAVATFGILDLGRSFP